MIHNDHPKLFALLTCLPAMQGFQPLHKCINLHKWSLGRGAAALMVISKLLLLLNLFNILYCVGFKLPSAPIMLWSHRKPIMSSAILINTSVYPLSVLFIGSSIL